MLCFSTFQEHDFHLSLLPRKRIFPPTLTTLSLRSCESFLFPFRVPHGLWPRPGGGKKISGRKPSVILPAKLRQITARSLCDTISSENRYANLRANPSNLATRVSARREVYIQEKRKPGEERGSLDATSHAEYEGGFNETGHKAGLVRGRSEGSCSA